MRYPNTRLVSGATPLMYACQQCKETDVLDILRKNPYAVKERDRTLKTPLHYCAENPNTSCAEAILKIAPELVNAQDENGYCPLHLAVIAGNKPLIKLLISQGANVNLYDNEGHSAVHWAIVSSEKEALEMIVHAGADPSTPDIHGGCPLHYAVQMCGSNADLDGKNLNEAVKVVQMLLWYGVNVNVTDKDGRQPILWAASAGSAKAIIHLINNGARVDAADKDGLTALHCAASRGHTETIETLVKTCGSEVDIIDANGCSALFYSVTLGHADSTAVLLDLGAQPNLQDRKGRTPAHCGAAKGQLETLKILQNHGGNLWLRNVKGDFPFHEAVASGRRELVLWFLQQNPDAINIGNNDGRCALHIAAMYNNSDMIKVLLDSKSLVNPVMRSSKGVLMTPLNVALCKGHRSSGKLLQLHGGVPFSKVLRSDANLSYAIRTSESILHDNNEWVGERVTPSFTVIRTSHNDNDEEVKTQSGEKKKVYRRRKKRKSHSNGRKLDKSESDSEESIYEEKRQGRRSSRSVHNDNKEMEADAAMNGEANKKRDNAITSIILVDDTAYYRTGGNESPGGVKTTDTVQTLEETTEIKPSQRKTSPNESKSLSSLSPGDFPSTMQVVNQLDSEITEVEIDGSKTPTEMENEKSNMNVQGTSDTGDSKEPVLSEVIEETEKNRRKEGDEGSKTSSSLLSPSFTVLEDNDLGKAVRSGPASSDELTKEGKSEMRKETSVQKIEKTTKTVHSKSSTVRKYEKTTAKGGGKKETRTQSDEKSSSGGSGRSNKSKTSGNEKSVKNSKKEDVENGGHEEQTTAAPQEDSQPDQGEVAISPAVEITETVAEETREKSASLNETNASEEKKASTDESEKLSEQTKETVADNSNAEVEKDGADDAADAKSNSDDFIVTSDHELPKKEILRAEEDGTGVTESTEKTDAIGVDPSAGTLEEADARNETPLNAVTNVGAADGNPQSANLEAAKEEEGREEAEDAGKGANPVVGDEEQEDEKIILLSEPEKSKSDNEIKSSVEENLSEGEKKPADEAAPVPEVIPSERSSGTVSDVQSVDPASIAAVSGPAVGSSTSARLRVADVERNEVEDESHRFDYIDLNPNASESPSPSWKTETNGQPAGKPTEELEDVERGHSEKETAEEYLSSDGSDLSPTQNSKSDTWMADKERMTGGGGVPRVSRLCRRNKDARNISQISVNQLVQGTIRKYHLERGIFHQLLELKRLQIRAGRANEQVLVKRLADEYERSCACLGMRHYTGTYKFKEFERFLYEQLKTLNRSHSLIPEMKSYDDIDALSGILKKSRFKIVSEVPPYEPQCSCITQRCHHTTRAYTSIPCSAYVASIRRNKSHRSKKESFLPRIEQFQPYRSEREKFCETGPTTLELIQGNRKQVIELPPTQSDKSKKYYITFTIKKAPNSKGGDIEDVDQYDDSLDDRKGYFKHRHAKSV